MTSGRGPWVWAGVAGLLATCAWVVAALMMANRGFDVTDEGFYVLSYRWWDSTPRVFTGVQYLYGPVFQALGWSVAGLRVVRLVTLVLTYLAFGWSFMAWLRTRRPEAPATRAWEVAGTLAILASGGITYGWLPLSPGYNDVVLITSLLLAALMLWSLRVVTQGGRLPVGAALCAGPPVVALVLAKWASAGVIALFLVVVGVTALLWLRARGWWRYLAAVLVSILACFLLVNAFVVPLRPLASQMTGVNRLVAADTNSPLHLLRMYAHSVWLITIQGAVVALAGLLLTLVGLFLRRRGFGGLGLTLIALGPVVTVVAANPGSGGIPVGHATWIHAYGVPLIALALLAVVARWWGSRTTAEVRPASGSRAADLAVVVLLLLLPAVQALGTGNPLTFLALDQFACWTALMVAACTMPGQVPAARVLAVSATAAAVILAATVGVSGLLRHPFRTATWSQATTRIGGTGPLAPIRVSAAAAARMRAIRAAAGRQSSGTPVMAFDEMAGVVLLLDGRTVGEVWYSHLDPARTAAGIRSVCEGHRRLGTTPVVVFNREPRSVDEDALRACGLSLDRDYRLVHVDVGRPHLQVYVPLGPEERTQP